MSKKLQHSKQKVFIVLAFPVHIEHEEEARIVDVYATRRGAEASAIRLINLKYKTDPERKYTYHVIEKSVNGTSWIDTGADIDYSIIHSN